MSTDICEIGWDLYRSNLYKSPSRSYNKVEILSSKILSGPIFQSIRSESPNVPFHHWEYSKKPAVGNHLHIVKP